MDICQSTQYDTRHKNIQLIVYRCEAQSLSRPTDMVFHYRLNFNSWYL